MYLINLIDIYVLESKCKLIIEYLILLIMLPGVEYVKKYYVRSVRGFRNA